MNDEHRIISGSYDENIDWKTGQSNPVSADQKIYQATLRREGETTTWSYMFKHNSHLALGYLSDPMQVDLDTAAPDPRKKKKVIRTLSKGRNLSPQNNSDTSSTH